MIHNPVSSAILIARLVVAPFDAMTEIFASEHFKAISDDIRPVQATKVSPNSTFLINP